jgi:hypothetical protein
VLDVADVELLPLGMRLVRVLMNGVLDNPPHDAVRDDELPVRASPPRTSGTGV